jgi:hypothetical protein
LYTTNYVRSTKLSTPKRVKKETPMDWFASQYLPLYVSYRHITIF